MAGALRERSKTAGPAIVMALLGAGVGIMVGFLDPVVALIAPTVIGLVLLFPLVRFLTSGEEGRQRVMRWTLAAFFLHLAFGLFIEFGSGPFRQYLVAPDAGTYDRLARTLVRHWMGDTPMPRLAPGKEGYYYLLAGIYWLFGTHLAAGLAVNAALAAAAVPVVADTTRRLFGPGAARHVPPLVVLLPGMLLWRSQLLKEAAIVFLVAVAANCATRMTERVSLGSLAGLALSLSLLFSFRAWVGLVMAAGLVAGIALGKGTLLSGLGTGLSGASVLAVLIALGLGYSGYRTAVSTDFEEADIVRKELAQTASTGFDADADVSTPGAALSYLPRGLLNFALGPFPWTINSTRQLPVVPEVLVWWWLIPALWIGQRAARQLVRRRALVLVLPAVTTAMLLSLAVGNFGTVVRERAQIIILLVPLMALGLAVRGERRPVSEGGGPADAGATRIPTIAS